jgi:beta-phosphoglucomutase-like phosphatase (HAD superfamily)
MWTNSEFVPLGINPSCCSINFRNVISVQINMRTVDAVIFDCEGVALDTEPLWDKSNSIVFGMRGTEYDRGEVKPLITGRSVRDIGEFLIRKYGWDDTPEKFERDSVETTRRLFETDIGYVPGFNEFYESQVVGSRKSAIATAMYDELMELADRKTGLIKKFNGHVYKISDVGGRGKPDPAVFNYAARMIGAVKGRTVGIEDAPHGIEALNRAGIFSIGIMTTYDKEKLKSADMIIDSYKELNLSEL